jgi:hypothetical protein
MVLAVCHDKHKIIYIRHYFLSRPRRFGKTLLLEAIEMIFQGNKDKLNGLWIYSSGYKFLEFPIIKLSLSMDSKKPELLWDGLMAKLMSIADRENLQVKKPRWLFFLAHYRSPVS